MPKDYSPFTPGQPVPLEFFVGRLRQVEQLKKKVAAAAATGRLQVAFLTGERGIGKSSLASFVRFIAERDHEVLGIHTFLGGVSTLEEMIRRIFDRLLKETAGKGWFQKIKGFFGDHIREVGLFDVSVEFRAPDEGLRRLLHDFAPAIRNLMKRLEGEKRGLFIALDDINGLASSSDFANWVKSLVDEIATSNERLPLCLAFVGLEERRQSLIGLNPSLARIFDIVDICAWDKKETLTFYRKTFEGVGVEVEQEALQFLVRYAGGLPVLAHEIGDAVFKADQDNKISFEDAGDGVWNAADVVGRKYLEPQVFQAIRSERYRGILRKLGEELGGADTHFKRSDLITKLTDREKKVLDNFLTKMKQLGVIRVDPQGERGGYCFQNLLHSLYFLLEALGAKRDKDR